MPPANVTGKVISKASHLKYLIARENPKREPIELVVEDGKQPEDISILRGVSHLVPVNEHVQKGTPSSCPHRRQKLLPLKPRNFPDQVHLTG